MTREQKQQALVLMILRNLQPREVASVMNLPCKWLAHLRWVHEGPQRTKCRNNHALYGHNLYMDVLKSGKRVRRCKKCEVKKSLIHN